MTIRPVSLDKSYRLLNHGPTVMVSAKNDNTEYVMSASWICTLDMFPAKLTAVTRQKVIHTATYRKEPEICNTSSYCQTS